MDIPESLWLPTPKDAVAQFASQRVTRYAAINVTLATQLTPLTYQVPNDVVLILLGWSFSASAGAAQTVLNASLQLLDIGGNQIGEIVNESGKGAQFVSKEQATRAYCMPTDKLNFVANFNAAAVGNSFATSIWGLLIPRANFQLG